MKFSYTGLFISVLILLSMLVWCHLSNYFYPKTQRYTNSHNRFIDLTIPTGTPPLQYNRISYSNIEKRIPCNLMNEAQIPCDIKQYQNCSNPQATKYELSDSELAILYKIAYEQAGMEIMKRTLDSITSSTNQQ